MFDRIDFRNIECCGCEVCSNVCPVGAIKIENDAIGFSMPKVSSNCIKCGKCSNICPANQRKKEAIDNEIFYGGYNKDTDEVIASASGGVFGFIVKEFLSKYPEGWVAGVVYNENFTGVKHILTQSSDKIGAMKSSKYMQSKKGDIYKKIREKLNNGCAVLFSGTPCEVDALNLFLGRDYEKLWTVDFICKGTTTPKVFKDYSIMLQRKMRCSITNVDMRYKWKSLDRWIPQYIKISFSNGKEVLKQFYNTEPGLAFMILRRNSCKKCPYREAKHYSDFTLGDYHAPFIGKKCENSLGTSVIGLNTLKSVDLWGEMHIEELVTESITKEDVYLYNRNVEDGRSCVLKQQLEVCDGVKAVRKSVGIKDNIKMMLPVRIMRLLTMRKKKVN